MAATNEGTKMFPAAIAVDTDGVAINWGSGVSGEPFLGGVRGGRGTFAAQATSFGGGTMQLQASFDGGTTWIAVSTDTTKTANGVGTFELGPCQIRAALTSSTSPVAAQAYVCSLGD